MGSLEDWQNSYHGKVRAAMGDATLMLLLGRGIIRDEQGRFLLIKRADNGVWSWPAGSMEIGESLPDCAIRETREETGLHAGKATLIALETGPQHTNTDIFGFTYQHISGTYLLTEISGDLAPDPEEATDAAFFDPAQLPEPVAQSVPRVLSHLAKFEATGCPVVE